MIRQILILLLMALALQAQIPDKNVQASYAEFIQKELEAQNLVGLSVAVIHNGAEWSTGYGFSDLENRVPATAQSRYRMASVSKPMTAAGILLLIQQGKINLDDDVRQYVPDFASKKHTVTIRHLLGHLSGISHYKDYLAEARTVEQLTSEQALAIFKDWPLLFPPGSAYQYTTYGYNLLGFVIENVSGQSYQEFMTQNIWGPLKMESMSVDYLYKLIPDRVRGYRKQEGEIFNSVPVSTSLKIAGGGTRGTALDMVRFADGLSSGKLLQKNWLDSMWTPMVMTDGRYSFYGMGWGISDFNGRYVVRHSGGQEGTRTYLLHLPAEKLSVAIASNLESSNPGYYAYRLLEEVLGEKQQPLQPWFASADEQMQYKMLAQVYKRGFSYYDYFQRPLSRGTKHLQASFNFVNSFSKSASKDSILEVGSYASEGSHFITVGSFMAQTLAEIRGEDGLQNMHKSGPLAFFNSYIVACSEFPQRIRFCFDDDFAGRIKNWDNTWKNFPVETLSNLGNDAEKAAAFMQKSFLGKSVYPDVSQELLAAAQQNLKDGSYEMAGRWAELLQQYYERQGDGSAIMGIAQLLGNGDKEHGLKYLQESFAVNPAGLASNMNLNRMAYDFAGLEKYTEAMVVLEAAIALHPSVANLYDSMGEMYLMSGKTEQAIAWYKKALKIDPELTSAKQMLKRIGSK